MDLPASKPHGGGVGAKALQHAVKQVALSLFQCGIGDQQTAHAAALLGDVGLLVCRHQTIDLGPIDAETASHLLASPAPPVPRAEPLPRALVDTAIHLCQMGQGAHNVKRFQDG